MYHHDARLMKELKTLNRLDYSWCWVVSLKAHVMWYTVAMRITRILSLFALIMHKGQFKKEKRKEKSIHIYKTFHLPSVGKNLDFFHLICHLHSYYVHNC